MWCCHRLSCPQAENLRYGGEGWYRVVQRWGTGWSRGEVQGDPEVGYRVVQ